MTSRFRAAVMGADRAAAESEARDLLSSGMSLLELYELLTDVMYDVGECWASGELTVAEEHQATATAAYLVDRLRGAPPAATRGTVVLTSLEGERHLLGLSLLAHLLERARFRAVAAGDLPVQEIPELAARHESLRAVLISAHLPIDTNLMQSTVRTLRREVPQAVVIVGGPALRNNGGNRYGAHAALLTARDALAVIGDWSSPLTERERQVLARMADGSSNTEIAETLGLAPSTVKDHVESILGKLNAPTRTAAVSTALRAGLLD